MHDNAIQTKELFDCQKIKYEIHMVFDLCHSVYKIMMQ